MMESDYIEYDDNTAYRGYTLDFCGFGSDLLYKVDYTFSEVVDQVDEYSIVKTRGGKPTEGRRCSEGVCLAND